MFTDILILIVNATPYSLPAVSTVMSLSIKTQLKSPLSRANESLPSAPRMHFHCCFLILQLRISAGRLDSRPGVGGGTSVEEVLVGLHGVSVKNGMR